MGLQNQFKAGVIAFYSGMSRRSFLARDAKLLGLQEGGSRALKNVLASSLPRLPLDPGPVEGTHLEDRQAELGGPFLIMELRRPAFGGGELPWPRKRG